MPENRSNKISCSNYKAEIEVAFEILSGKWVSLILWNLSDGNVKRFGELKRLMPSITQKMLTQQLRYLEKNGLIKRKVYPEIPPVVEYSLTEIGKKLTPALNEINEWAKEYLEGRQK